MIIAFDLLKVGSVVKYMGQSLPQLDTNERVHAFNSNDNCKDYGFRYSWILQSGINSSLGKDHVASVRHMPWNRPPQAYLRSRLRPGLQDENFVADDCALDVLRAPKGALQSRADHGQAFAERVPGVGAGGQLLLAVVHRNRAILASGAPARRQGLPKICKGQRACLTCSESAHKWSSHRAMLYDSVYGGKLQTSGLMDGQAPGGAARAGGQGLAQAGRQLSIQGVWVRVKGAGGV